MRWSLEAGADPAVLPYVLGDQRLAALPFTGGASIVLGHRRFALIVLTG
jgi:hypothetical protein